MSADPFTLHTPEYTLTVSDGAGVRAVHDRWEAETELHRAVRTGVRSPLVVGALPFGGDAPASLMVAQATRTGPGRTARPDGHRPGPRLLSRREHPSAQEYVRLVRALVDRIAGTELEKVVLARTLLLRFDGPLDPARILSDLVSANPNAWNFAVTLRASTPGAARTTLVGASPESLLSRRGRRVSSHPLAGSIPRHPDPDLDRERAADLRRSGKDRSEHAFVVEAIAARLRPLCSSLRVPSVPSLLATPTMWHLGTPISGILKEPAPSSLALAAALHPTPAVCGTPSGAAARAIASREPFDRGAYAGAVGWCAPDGDGDWAVVLRCAEISAADARLFAGAGIVADSVPAAELAETEAKFHTMLDALGAGRAADPDVEPIPAAHGENT